MSDRNDKPQPDSGTRGSGSRVSPTPWWHETPNQTPGGPEDPGGPGGGSSWPTNERRSQTVNLSDSILDNPIPVVYGSCRVNGRIGFWNYNSSGRTLDLGIVLCYGEQDDCRLSAVNLDTSPNGVSMAAEHTGDGTTTLTSWLTGASGWTAADTTQWQGYCHFVARAFCTYAQLPPTPKFSAVCDGKLVTPIGGGTATAATNPATIAYDILTAAEFGNMNTSELDDDSFQAVEDFSDEIMADSLTRYAFTGAILERDALTAANYVLRHCNGYLYSGPDGKIHAWAEMLPPLITGTWTALTTGSGTYEVTEDSTAGAATSELEVGQLVIYDGKVAKVTSITDDDTFYVVFTNGTPSASSVPVRAGGTKHVKKTDWVDPPTVTESSRTKIPDVVKARFPDTSQEGSHEVTVSYGSNTDRVSNLNYNVPEAAHALRAAKTRLLLAQLSRFYWSGKVPWTVGAHLEPGDVIFLNDDLVENQAVTVQQPITINQDGSYNVTFREFDPGAFEEGTEATDSIPSTGTSFEPADAPITWEIDYEYSGTIYSMVDEYSGRTRIGNTSRGTWLGGTEIELPNNIPLYARETGGTQRHAIKMDSSNRLTLGDASTSIYLNASTSGGILIPDDVGIYPGWSASSTYRFWEYISASNRHQVGNGGTGGPELVLSGRPVELNSTNGPINLTGYYSFAGYQSYAGNPSTSLMTTVGMWQIWKNTSTGAIYLAFRDTSSIKKVQLT